MSESLDEFAEAKLAALQHLNLKRTVTETERLGPVDVLRGGKRLISFSCNDYLNLSQHPDVKAAAIAATEKFGTGSGASRLVTGNHPLFATLEAKLAKLKGTQSACVLGSGYLANSGIIPALVGKDDMICVDELSHACIYAGASLAQGAVHIFRHNDMDHLREILEGHRKGHPHALIVTDRVFSMDGDLAPVSVLADIADEHDAWLMTDDAHGIGVVGPSAGTVPLQMGTLSKAIGGYGGYLCASQAVIDLIRTRCRTFIYSTGLPPGVVAAAIAALDLIAADPEFAARPLAKAIAFTRLLDLKEAESPIVPIVIGDTERTMAAARMLEDEGFLVVPIRPPTVPEGTARLRITFTAAHDDADIERLADIIKTRILDTP
ncbi:MAG: aminotransferase class I/II-fold pyridoxal phosphate-dependent enzyme [Proteobacteria bacterium]|nr:aminotransferase class I/II-fold pyridoxal phosphate-dependent enzyme [Pseudomonadota bacterium]MDA1023376.1 aminotransferase class I/II-fold pyridoxal phosphate-dependent enzyme [Pseudomonadota bacterium]